MTHLRFKPFATLAVMLAGMLVTACGSTGTPQDGRYQTHDGGRSNFRAEAPMLLDPALHS
jgi:hypothetical protein